MTKNIYLLICAIGCAPLIAAQNEPAPSSYTEEVSIQAVEETAVNAYQAGNYQDMELALQRALELRPFLAHLRLLLAKAHALQDEKTEAFTALITLHKQGLYFDIAEDKDFENLRGLGVFDYVLQNMEVINQPYGNPETIAEIPENYELVEAMAYDTAAERTFFADARIGGIYTVDSQGNVATFAESTKLEPIFSIFDLEIDRERNVLWALSTVSSYLDDPDPRFAGRTFILRYDLESGERTGTFRTRERTRLIDLAVSPENGTIFAVNGATPTVWMLPADRLSEESGSMEVLLNIKDLGAFRTITVNQSGDTLYFSEYERGLFGHKLRDNRSFTVNMGDQLNTSGIDSMNWHDDSLILLQNGYQPHRVLRLMLADDGVRARHAQAMLSNLEEFQSPTTMDVVDGQAYVIANSHRNLFDPATGDKVTEAELDAHVVLRGSVNFGWMPPPVNLPGAGAVPSKVDHSGPDNP